MQRTLSAEKHGQQTTWTQPNLLTDSEEKFLGERPWESVLVACGLSYGQQKMTMLTVNLKINCLSN